MRVALCAKMRAGKDTFAEELVSRYGYKDFRFSSGITKLINELFPNSAEGNKKLREYYQVIGQSMRQLDQDVWVNILKREVNRYLLENMNREPNIVVTDLRQVNEYEFLKRNGFIIVKIKSDEDVRINRAKSANDVFDLEAFKHETELAVDNIKADYVIENNGTLEEFRDRVGILMIRMILDEFDKESKSDSFIN